MPTDTPDLSAPRLLADIGATYARFCLERERGVFERVAVLACADHPDFISVVRAYLDSVPDVKPRHGAMAIAYPIDGDAVRMTNRDWAFSIQDVQQRLGLGTLLVVNNFTALAVSLPHVGPEGRVQVGGGTPAPEGVIGLLGPGTGLGVSALIPSNDRWVTLATEGGHTSFAPLDERELRVLRHVWKSMPHVSAERLVSGPGIELIHSALHDDASPLSTAEIVRRALLDIDPACTETIDCFCAMLGTVASNLALTLGATGGIYVGGGIVPRLGELFLHSGFRQRFEDKGRFSSYLARIPTYVLTADNLAFEGLSTLLAEHAPANVPDRDGGNPLIERVRNAREGLSPAERRVANMVLDNPRAALNEPIAAIARQADVSQPTVIRFCRSLGFEGLADFKLKLGSGLTGSIPLQHTQVRRQDATADLCAKVLDNTISSIVQLRESLNIESIDRAIGLLREAQRVELYAIGNSSVVALDAQHKLFRFRIPVVAHTDASMLALAAEALGPQAVAVIVSSSGQTAELVRAAQTARDRGATVIAITANQSPLARKADVCIAVEHGEDSSTFISMISRILHLLVVDMVAVGLAVRRMPAPGGRHDGPDSRQTPAPGVLISHID
jgi:glucokinase